VSALAAVSIAESPQAAGAAGEKEIEFLTSGSTGEPVRWLRTASQLRAEAEVLVAQCAAATADGVISYAPPRHLYGYLMGLEVPRLLDVPCLLSALMEPPALALARLRHPVVVAVPAAFAVLERAVTAFDRAERVTLVHSSALLPPTALRLLARLGPRARLIELFGSTETGLIATRESGRGDWTLAPDVRFADRGAGKPGSGGPGPHTLLHVSSQRLARLPGQAFPEAIQTDDVVSVLDDRSFRWHGRRGRLVKINGLRVNLDAIRARLADAVPLVPVDCVPETDEVRGEWYSVVATTADPSALRQVEEAVLALPGPQRPRTVRPVRPAGPGHCENGDRCG